MTIFFTSLSILATVGLIVLFRVLKLKYFIDFLSMIDTPEPEDFAYGTKTININDLKPANYDHAIDLRGTPTHVCVCVCHIWNLKVIFENFEIATYFIDMECANCGSFATAPTPIDKEAE
jgi:hypothetical protein